MAGYHPYVFDVENRVFVGKFEEMYRAEKSAGFDSWHQEDLRDLSKKFALAILEEYSFTRILDVGCGKGAFTQFLKKKNNNVLAIDISATALKAAQERFPDIDFCEGDLETQNLNDVVRGTGGHFDALVCLETLSYLQNWQDIVADFAKLAEYALIALYIPENPIGFVKSMQELADCFINNFQVIEDIRFVTQNRIILFGKRYSANGR